MGAKRNHQHAAAGGLSSVLVTALALFGGPAAADEHTGAMSYYGSVSGIYVSPRDSKVSTGSVSGDVDMDAGFGLLAAMGYGADIGLRGEIELGYRGSDFDKLNGRAFEGDVRTWSLMANGIYAFEAGTVRPYFGIGLGLARHKVSSSRASDSDTVFAYQGMAGVAYPLSETLELRGGYRYFATADADFDGLDASYGSHNFEAGVWFRF